MSVNNKWVRAAIPALLIHMSVGTVYCWSIVKEAIANQIGMSSFSVGWAFSLAIFFLGMSAAFAGKFVERDIHKSSLIACLCFSVGMIATGIVLRACTGIAALIGIYLFYGVIMGIGLGIGYLTPVKTLMLWFSNNKGLATGISIMGFGLAKAIATPVMVWLQNVYGISGMLMILGIVYFVTMFTGHLLLKKPNGWVEPRINIKGSDLSMFRQKEFLGIWLIFFLNIHCGLMIISYEKQILQSAFALSSALPAILSIIPSLTAGVNALGRIGYSALSDKMTERKTVYNLIFYSSFIVTMMVYFTQAIHGVANIVLASLVILFLFVINAGYGGGFSTLPALLSERFGMSKISSIHGLALSAWAVAGLTGNNMSELILNKTGGYDNILFVQMALYVIALYICTIMVGAKNSKIN